MDNKERKIIGIFIKEDEKSKEIRKSLSNKHGENLKKYIKCGKNHVFIDPDFLDIILTMNHFDTPLRYIKYDHNIHIFISRDYDDLDNESLINFFQILKNIRYRKLMIHIPRSEVLYQKIKYNIPSNIENIRIIKEGNTNPFIFFHDERLRRGNNGLELVNTFLSVTYNIDKYEYKIIEKEI